MHAKRVKIKKILVKCQNYIKLYIFPGTEKYFTVLKFSPWKWKTNLFCEKNDYISMMHSKSKPGKKIEVREARESVTLSGNKLFQRREWKINSLYPSVFQKRFEEKIIIVEYTILCIISGKLSFEIGYSVPFHKGLVVIGNKEYL